MLSQVFYGPSVELRSCWVHAFLTTVHNQLKRRGMAWVEEGVFMVRVRISAGAGAREAGKAKTWCPFLTVSVWASSFFPVLSVSVKETLPSSVQAKATL